MLYPHLSETTTHIEHLARRLRSANGAAGQRPRLFRRARLLAALAALLAGIAVAGCGGHPADSGLSGSSTPSITPSGPGPASTAPPGRAGAIADGADPNRTDAAGIEWLCRPGQAGDPCEAPGAAQVVPQSGPITVHPAGPAANPPVDCFYIMPTVSTQPGISANLTIEPTETETAELQASRFSQVCKVYAPVYPQITRKGLTKAGSGSQAGIAAAYAVIQSAWQDYLAHYNDGRGVVIIGHSQGSVMAEELLRTQVDPNPKTRQQLVSAIIPGGNVVVPAGQQVGGTFKNLPACGTSTQLHCVVAYSSFSQAPPPTSFFGVPGQGVSRLDVTPQPVAGMRVLCVNPAQLTSGGKVQPYLPSAAAATALKAGKSLDGVAVPWQTSPDLYSASCKQQSGASWLQVTAPVTPGDSRPVVSPRGSRNFGLHRYDINLFLGNLVTLVQDQTRSYQAVTHGPAEAVTAPSGGQP